MAAPRFDRHVFVCTNQRPPGAPKGDCIGKGGEQVREAFKALLRERGIAGRCRANAAGCLDQCARGVTVVVYPEQVWYQNVTPGDVAQIVDEHVIGGVPVERLRLK
jgi:(2Fe-2S) ferredoxin